MGDDTGRNNALNIAAYSMGCMIAEGLLYPEEVERELLNAALECRLRESDARMTIRSGMRGGQLKGRRR
jgi:hypothetical protein